MPEEKNGETQAPTKSWFIIEGKVLGELEFAQWAQDQVTKHPVVTQHHGSWKELIAWEEGDQFSLWNDTKRRMSPVDLVTRKVKCVVNMMKPLIETIDAKIQVQHQVVGTPNSGENKDIFGSQVATRLVNFNDYTVKIDTVLERMKYDLLRPGNACIKWIWDKEFGSAAVAPKKEDGTIDMEKKTTEKGDVVAKVVPIFNVRPDPTAKEQADLRWVIEIMEVTEEDLLKAYPKAKALIEELQPGAKDMYVGTNEKEDEKDKAMKTYIVKEFWERASANYPKGRYIVCCQNRVLFKDANPSPKARLPYFFFFYKKNPYSFWSHGPLYYIQDLQRQTNRLVSMELEHIEAWKPKMAVGKGAIKTAAAFTIDPFEMVEVDFTKGEPRPIPMPELSPQVAAMRDFIIGSIDRVSNVHEVSYARLPQYASRAPASLYQMMLEQESTKLDPLVAAMNATFLDMDQFRLQLMDKHYKMPRLVKIMGKNKSATIGYFESADLSQNFDVRLEQGVSLSQSPTIQVRMITELYAQGILDQKDKPKILRILNLGTAENELREDMADYEKAMRENQAFIDGKWDKSVKDGGVRIYIHDDHALHLDEHTSLIKSEEATQWKEATFNGLDEHINDHFLVLSFLQAGKTPEEAMAGISNTAIPAQTPAEEAGVAQTPGPMPGAPGAQQIPAPGGGSMQPLIQ